MKDAMGIFVNEHTVKIERLLPGPIERVFEHITDSKLVSDWMMPAKIEGELGGLVEFVTPPVPEGLVDNIRSYSEDVYSYGLINEFEPPKVIAYSWNESIYDSAQQFKIELNEHGDQVLLVLTHSHIDTEWMAVTATGWHVQLEVLRAILNGDELPEIEPLFNKLLKEYKLIIAGAGIALVASAASPAMASELSDQAYKQVKAQKHELLVKYDHVWKDTKRINSDISKLERASQRNDRAIDSLCRDLKDKKRQLKDIELDIRDLDKVLR